MTRTPLMAACAAILITAIPGAAQDANFHMPIPELESRLSADSFRILNWRGSRAVEDRTQRVTLAYSDSSVIPVKWASAPRGGSRFNNEPRYEAAAYVIQKLFLEPEHYVVPPVVLRAVPLETVKEQMPKAEPTFREAPQSVLVALQYWMFSVSQDGFWSEERLRRDTAYARHIANFNILTYLIRHRDSNIGNYLISTDSTNPRVFSVDNGVAFASQDSNRGDDWRHMRVDRLPRETVERLNAITREDLEAALAVIAEFEIRDGQLIPVEPGPNLSRGAGVRVKDNRVQLGLHMREIREIHTRLRTLVREAGNGTYRLF